MQKFICAHTSEEMKPKIGLGNFNVSFVKVVSRIINTHYQPRSTSSPLVLVARNIDTDLHCNVAILIILDWFER